MAAGNLAEVDVDRDGSSADPYHLEEDSQEESLVVGNISTEETDDDDEKEEEEELSGELIAEGQEAETVASSPANETDNATIAANGTADAGNATASANATGTPKQLPKRAICRPRTAQNDSLEVEIAEPVVWVVNGSTFLTALSDQVDANVTNRTTPAQCSLAFFYASWCPFSARAAPHFNGLARLFPDVKLYAIDTSDYHTINTQFGIMALPTLILFHNAKAVAKYNQSEYELENFAKHLTMFTSLEASPELPMNLTESDYAGPVPTKELPVTDYYLYVAYVFTVLVALRHFGRSSYFKRSVESIRNTWREVEVQHEHQE
jgi:thiol-disulfide isomerase/thioredoxin